MAAAEKGKKKRAPLSSFTILLIILVVLAIVTVIMSASGVEGVQGATLSQVLTAPVFGFQDAIGVCLFVMILGGFLGIVTETGALDAGIAALVHKLKGNELVLIPILMFIFSIGGTTYGMCEETVPFYLLLAATRVAAGFDSLTGAAVVLLGAGCGVLGSTENPFAVGVAVDALSGIGIAVNQGIIIALGAILWLTTTIISIIFVMRYAKKVKADKGSTFLSLQEQQDMMNEWGMTDSEAEAADGQDMAPKMTGRQKATLIVFALTFVIMIVSFIPWEDLGFDGFVAGQSYEEVTTTVAGDEVIAAYDEANGTTTEVAAPFEATSVSEEEVTPAWSSFLSGIPLGQWYFDEASTWFLLMALIIGLMAKTGLDMWILNNAANALAGMSAIIFAPLSFLLYIVLSFLIPSSSGMATVSMPIMGGLASQLNFSVETMVMIYSAGNGLVNLFTPTSGAIMGGLALAKVEYSTWLKFGAKLFVVLGVVCIVILTAAMVILS